MSLERIKTFEELSPDVTSMLDVSNGMSLLNAPWQDLLPGSIQPKLQRAGGPRSVQASNERWLKRQFWGIDNTVLQSSSESR